jgi:hypothetical protein
MAPFLAAVSWSMGAPFGSRSSLVICEALGGLGGTLGDFCIFCILEGVSRGYRNLIENKADLAFCIFCIRYCLYEEHNRAGVTANSPWK